MRAEVKACAMVGDERSDRIDAAAIRPLEF
jgi:hypothetical protein